MWLALFLECLWGIEIAIDQDPGPAMFVFPFLECLWGIEIHQDTKNICEWVSFLECLWGIEIQAYREFKQSSSCSFLECLWGIEININDTLSRPITKVFRVPMRNWNTLQDRLFLVSTFVFRVPMRNWNRGIMPLFLTRF